MKPRAFATIVFISTFMLLAYTSPSLGKTETGYTVTVYVTGFPSTYTTNVRVDQVWHGTIPGGGSKSFEFNASTSHWITVDSYVTARPDTRYYCLLNLWRCSAGGTYTFTYSAQFYLTVKSPHSTTSGSGWYDAGTTAYASIGSALTSGEAGTRYRFVGWIEDASGTSLVSNSILMDRPKIANANWTTQYYLTVNTSPPEIKGATGEGWYDLGTTATFSASSPISGAVGQRYVFTHWIGDNGGASLASSTVMNKPKTLTANYKTQYYLTVNTSPPEIKGATGEGWYDLGTTAAAGVASSPVASGAGMRHVFDTWSLDGSTVPGNPISFIMDTPHVAVARYRMQFYLRVVSQYGDPQGEGWYDAGKIASFSVSPSVSGGIGVKHIFERWSGDFNASSPSATVLMNAPRTVTAVWRTDYTQLFTIVSAFVGAVAAAGTLAILILKKPRSFPLLLSKLRERLKLSLGRARAPPMKVTPAALPRKEFGFAAPRCIHCGAPIQAEAVYCDKCGRKREALPESTVALDDGVYSYIVEHGGVISWKLASKDLNLTEEELRSATERLKKSGKLVEHNS